MLFLFKIHKWESFDKTEDNFQTDLEFYMLFCAKVCIILVLVAY